MTSDEAARTLTWPRILWTLVALLCIFAGMAAAGFHQFQQDRICRISRIFAEEIHALVSLRSALATQRTPEPFILELVEKSVLRSRHPYHQELASLLERPAPQVGDLGSLSRLEPALREAPQCGNFLEKYLPESLNDQEELRALQAKQRTVTEIWNEAISRSQPLAARLAQDFEHDRKVLCHSRKNLGNLLLLEHFMEDKCKRSRKYRCKNQLAKISAQAQELASVEKANISKFAEKWGEARLHSATCE